MKPWTSRRRLGWRKVLRHSLVQAFTDRFCSFLRLVLYSFMCLKPDGPRCVILWAGLSACVVTAMADLQCFNPSARLGSGLIDPRPAEVACQATPRPRMSVWLNLSQPRQSISPRQRVDAHCGGRQLHGGTDSPCMCVSAYFVTRCRDALRKACTPED